jgi:hypothetical protein
MLCGPPMSRSSYALAYRAAAAISDKPAVPGAAAVERCRSESTHRAMRRRAKNSLLLYLQGWGLEDHDRTRGQASGRGQSACAAFST